MSYSWSVKLLLGFHGPELGSNSFEEAMDEGRLLVDELGFASISTGDWVSNSGTSLSEQGLRQLMEVEAAGSVSTSSAHRLHPVIYLPICAIGKLL
jgi:hypothetical protein